MKCPKCRDSKLRPHRPRPDLEVDHCPSCKGVWLDKNELYQFVRRPNKVYKELVEAYKSVTRTAYLCPRCANTSMVQALIPSAQMMIEACPACGGNFFDANEIQKLNAALAAEGPVKNAAPVRRMPTDLPRPLDEDDLVRYGGADFSFLFALMAVLFADFFLAFSLVLRRRPLLDRMFESFSTEEQTILAIFSVPAFLLSWYWLGRRRRTLRSGMLVEGTIEDYGEVEGTRIPVEVSFSIDGSNRTVRQMIDYRGILDQGLGGKVCVVARPGPFSGAVIVPDPS